MKIDGVEVIELTPNEDERGIFTELFRNEWKTQHKPKQWNIVQSKNNVLRGVHVHIKHSDYLFVVHGKIQFNLIDLRKKSSTHQKTMKVILGSNDSKILFIPPGVAHGFYMLEDSTHIYSVSEYWDLKDELGCRFDDPNLGVDWPSTNPIISKRDKSLPPLKELLAQYSF